EILVWLIIGLIAGGIASMIVPGRTSAGAIGAIVVGILGGLLGGWILDVLDVDNSLSWIGALIVATIGAVIILYALRAMDGRKRV
nr:GlsB/YeaQ/YmgE family stress response membrane protein [Chloroflexota bacterium]